MKLRCVLDGGRYFEGPRWHAGRLWFVDCMERTLLSLSPSGEREQHAKFDDDTPCGVGILPDGRLVVLTMYRKRLMTYVDGRLSLYADLSGIATGTIDDMIIDGLGRAYVGDLGFDMPPPPDRGACGRIILVMPGGAARVVAEGLRFPNGIAVSSDHRRLVVAEMDGACLADYDIEADGSLKFRGRFGSMQSPDGICLDQQGAVWVAAFEEDAFIRLDPGGRAAADRSARPPRPRLRPRRARAENAVLPERSDVLRRTPATQIVIADRRGRCGNCGRRLSLKSGPPYGRGFRRALASAAIAHPRMAAAPIQIRKSLHRPATPSARPGMNVADKSSQRKPGRARAMPRRFGSTAARSAMQAALTSAPDRPSQPSSIIRRTARRSRR
jgi:sugar lactone lactonase YvrE